MIVYINYKIINGGKTVTVSLIRQTAQGSTRSIREPAEDCRVCASLNGSYDLYCVLLHGWSDIELPPNSDHFCPLEGVDISLKKDNLKPNLTTDYVSTCMHW